MSTVEGKKQEKRRALLDAAYELFLERGTSKTSVEDITCLLYTSDAADE